MNSTEFDDPENVLEEEAAGWVVEREQGFAPGRGEAFAEWHARDRRHAEALARVESTLSLLKMSALRASVEARVGRTEAKRPGPASIVPVAASVPWAWAAGLAAAVVLSAAAWWWSVATPAPATQTFTADESGPCRVALSDGSVVDLNANSRLQVRLTEAERRVTLLVGEAHFQVAHNAARPFIVTANGVLVRAVGTAFDVRLMRGKVDVFVTEGRVQLSQTEASSSQLVPIVPLLVAGQRTEVSPNANLITRVEEVVPAAAHALLSWQDRMTSFTDVPLREMVARINRCNSRQLVLMDSGLGDRKIGGVIDLSQVDAFVHLLEQDGDVAAERQSDGKILLRRTR